MPPAPDDDEGPRPRQGSDAGERRGERFYVPHRGGTRVEVGEAVHIGGERPWMCAVKLVGQKHDVPEDGDLELPEPTQTLLVRTGRGDTPEDARREALAHLTLVYGSPVAPPPDAIISQKPSEPPPPMDPPAESPPAPAAKGWIANLLGRLLGRERT